MFFFKTIPVAGKTQFYMTYILLLGTSNSGDLNVESTNPLEVT